LGNNRFCQNGTVVNDHLFEKNDFSEEMDVNTGDGDFNEANVDRDGTDMDDNAGDVDHNDADVSLNMIDMNVPPGPGARPPAMVNTLLGPL
jgi:hypothetical protein